MQCNCGEVLAQEVPGVVCVKCKAKFHRECFESQVEGSHFYCELCTLKLMEPLVAFDQKDELAFREVEYSAALWCSRSGCQTIRSPISKQNRCS